MHIEPYVVRRRLGRSHRLHFRGLRGQCDEIEIGADREARDENVAAEQQILLRALQLQVGVGQRTYALRVANADALAGDIQVGENAVLVREIARNAQLAAAAGGCQRAHFKPVLVELQRAVQLAQAVGQVFESQRRILKVDAAAQARIVQRAVRFNLEGRSAAGGQIRIDGFQQLQIDGAARCHVQLPLAANIEPALHMQVCFFSGDVQRIEIHMAVLQRGTQAAFAAQVHARDGDRHLLQLRLAMQLLHMRQRPGHIYRASQ